MRLKFLQVTFVTAMLLLGSIAVLSPAPKVYAENLLQDAPSLAGQKIYFTEANGESSRFDRSINGLSRFAGILSDVGATLETLEWRTTFPSDADLIIVAGPLDDFDPSQTARLWNYIDNGGKVLLLVEPLRMERGRPSGMNLNSGLMQLLWTDLGMRVRNDVVVTEGQAVLPGSPVVGQAAVDAPAVVPAEATAEATDDVVVEATAEVAEIAPLPLALPLPVSNFTTSETTDDNPILRGINQPLAFFGARSIEIDLSIRDFPVQPLVFSNSEFYGENNIPAYYDGGIALYNIGQDVPPGFLPLATSYENAANGTRIVMISDRDFATNGGGLQSSPPNTGAFLFSSNIHFLLNSVAWLTGTEADQLSFPTPGPTSTPTLVPTPQTVDPLAVHADLEISITVSNIRPAEGEIIIYNINVINRGPDTVENIIVTDDLPVGIQYILGSGGTFNGESNQWLIPGLEATQGETLRLVVGVLRGTVNTTITNRVEITNDNFTDPNADNNAAAADIQIADVVLKDPAQQEGG